MGGHGTRDEGREGRELTDAQSKRQVAEETNFTCGAMWDPIKGNGLNISSQQVGDLYKNSKLSQRFHFKNNYSLFTR